MLKPVYVRYQGDLYEVAADILGEIVNVYVYRDNCGRTAEKMDVHDLPPVVLEEVNNKITTWYNL